MIRKFDYLSLLIIVLFAISCKESDKKQSPVLVNVLSHNDYEQPRPLLDALAAGINYIEVDVALQNGELYVTHTIEEINTQNTFEALYLKPLRELNELPRGRAIEVSK